MRTSIRQWRDCAHTLNTAIPMIGCVLPHARRPFKPALIHVWLTPAYPELMEPEVIHMGLLLVVTEEGVYTHAMPPLGHEYRLARVAMNHAEKQG